MSVTGLTGSANTASAITPNRQMPSPSQTAASNTAAGSREPVDSVHLSPEAAKALDGRARTITIPPPGAAGSGASSETQFPQIDRKMLDPAVMAARNDYHQKMGDYAQQLRTLVSQTFGVPDDQPFMVGGAGMAMLDSLAARNGLEKPEVPAAMREAGWKDPFEEDRKDTAGVFGIGMPGSDRNIQIAFDTKAKAPLDKLRLVEVNNGAGSSDPLLGAIKSGTLNRYTDSRAEPGAKLWAVTDGESGANARVYATVRSVGMDDVASSSALGMLKTIKGLLAG